MFSDIKNVELCKKEKIELDLYSGIYLHPSDSGVETEDDSGVHFTNVKYDFRLGIFPKDFWGLILKKDSFIGFGQLVENSAKDPAAQEIVKYVYHEASRKILGKISEKSGNVSWYFLAVGCPEGAGLFGAISMAADIILILDDFYQAGKQHFSGNEEKRNEHLIRGGRQIVVFALVKASGKIVEKTNKYIEKNIVIIVGKNKKYYSLGRRGAIKKREALLKLMIKDFANGYFGTDVAPAIFEEMIDKSLNKLYKYLDENGEEDGKTEETEKKTREGE